MKRALIVPIAAAVAWAVAGCGEKPTVTVYKDGEYKGKPDTQPWANDQFKGDRAGWEKAVKARNVGQNEYVRVSGG